MDVDLTDTAIEITLTLVIKNPANWYHRELDIPKQGLSGNITNLEDTRMPESRREISPGNDSQNEEDTQDSHRESEIQSKRVDKLSSPKILWEHSR